jgi:putative transposase
MDWPHAPFHRFGDEPALYFVTGATYLKQHFYRSRERLERLQTRFFALARQHDCRLQAWSIFSNHYHLVAAVEGSSLRHMLTALHREEGLACNREEGERGRRIWFQFRETQLTFERSWLARLKYTHHNAVHHGLVREATDYRWCSAGWFERTARPSFVKTVDGFKIDRVHVQDDFVVACGDEIAIP